MAFNWRGYAVGESSVTGERWVAAEASNPELLGFICDEYGWTLHSEADLMGSDELYPLLETWRAGDDRAAARDFRILMAREREQDDGSPDDGSPEPARPILEVVK